MSDAGDIITAITTDVQAAVDGVTVGLEAISFDDLATVQLPYCVLLLVDYTVEPLAYGQEQRTWTIAGGLVQSGGTRETMQTKLEAVRDEVFSDPTLDASVDRASFAPLSVESHSDSQILTGDFSIVAEKVA